MARQNPPLPVRIRLLAQISTFYAIGKKEKAKRLITRALRTKDAPPLLFSELFIHLSLFLGYPAMLDGLEHLCVTATIKRRSIPVQHSSRASRGAAILRQIYGSQTRKVLSHLDELEPGLAKRIAKDAYGEIMSRPGLNLQEREIVNCIVLFLQGYAPQLFSHLRGALRVGVDVALLKSVVQLAGRLARKESGSALKLIDALANSLRRTSF